MNACRGGNKGSVSSSSLADYDKLIGYRWLHDAILQIRGEQKVVGKDMTAAKLKGQLPFRCAHYYRFINNKRRQDHIDPESFLFQTSVDIDEKDLVETAIEMAKMLNETETLGCKNGETMANPWKGMLLHMEYSARKKLHIDIRMPIGMTIEETQRAYCDALGVPCDESCFSPERIIFITDKASEIYRSPHWYEILPDEELRVRREAFLKRGLGIDGRKQNPNQKSIHNSVHNSIHNSIHNPNSVHNSIHNPNSVHNSIHNSNQNETKQSVLGSPQVPVDSASHPANSGTAVGAVSPAPHPNGSVVGNHSGTDAQMADKSLIAFDLFRQQANLSNVDINQEGSRHSSLLAILSAGASRVMSEQELMRVVAIRMPAFSQEYDCQQLIHDFYAKYCDNTKPFSRDVIRINAQAEAESQKQKKLIKLGARSEKIGVSGERLGVSGELEVASPLNARLGDSTKSDDNFPPPPDMPKKLPKLVELLISRTPDIYKPAVACAIFPPLATHLWKTTFRYIDNVDHEATLMCALLAGTGAGKNCVQMPINLIMEDIRKRDKENLEREKEWKDEVTRKGANKDKRKRPQNLIIQEIDADMTNPAFVMRTAEAQEHFLYTSLNEIDQFDALRGQGNQQFRIMCLAFDPGNQYGQTRVGTQSVTERVTIRFNWNASTTINKGKKYFAKVLTDGPISRINFCTIPEREIGAEMPVYGTYDDAFREALRPYVENLCKATGEVECPEAYQLALKLKEENADFARLSQSRIYENLSFRANVIAYLKACVLFVANGYKWEPEMEDFIRWSERYDLWCKTTFFGEEIEKADSYGVKSSQRGPTNLLQLLPDEFTAQEVLNLRQQLGMKDKGTRKMLNTWVARGYVERVNAMVVIDGQVVSRSAVNGNSGNGNSGNSFRKLQYKNFCN